MDTKKQRRLIFRISICPTRLEQGFEGDTLDSELLLTEIERMAKKLWPHCEIRFDVLQVGHRQGDEFADAWDDGVRFDDLADTLLASIDYSAEKLYVKN